VVDFTIFFDLAGDLATFVGLVALGFLAAFGLAGDLALAGDFGLAGELAFYPDAFPVFLALGCLAGLEAAGVGVGAGIVATGAGVGVVATGAGSGVVATGAGAGVVATGAGAGVVATGAGAGVDAGFATLVLGVLVLGVLVGLFFEADLDDYVYRCDTLDLCAVLAICYVYSLVFLLPFL